MTNRALDSKYTWFETYYGRRLHFIPKADEERVFWKKACWGSAEMPVEALAACGLKGHSWIAPSIFSRMGLPRCKPCCAAVGIPEGAGTPFNSRDELVKEMDANN